MELLKFKTKFMKLCDVTEISSIGEKIFDVVLNHNIDFYTKYLNMIEENKDWLQALYQYYLADRQEKKQDYTPKNICKLLYKLAGETKTLYDCCGGSGALTKVFIENNDIKNIYIDELDERVIPFLLFNLCLSNANGYVLNGDTLKQEFKKIYKLEKNITGFSKCKTVTEYPEINVNLAISNPPYNIKWHPPLPLDNDERFPIIPPKNNANFAFVLNCISKAEKALFILPTAVLNNKDKQECEIKKYLIDNNLIEGVIAMPNEMFEMTSIATIILVLNKNKKTNDVYFINSSENYTTEIREQRGQYGGSAHTERIYKKEYKVLSDENINKIIDVINKKENIQEFAAFKTNDDIRNNNYTLRHSSYIEYPLDLDEGQHRDFQEIVDNINYITKIQNSCQLIINETIAKRLGLNIEDFKKNKENSKQIKEQMKLLNINMEIEDYIQFTKNKNEFVFKCNDKEFLPDILLQFLSVWKNQIALLNTMQNNYLVELRDSLLSDLMSGKIKLF